MFNLDPQLLTVFSSLLGSTILVLLGWAAFSIFVFIHTPIKYYLRLLLIPGIFVIVIFCSLFLSESFGYAVPYYLPNHFHFLGYKVDSVNYIKTTIEIWVIEGNKTRLYVIPYSKDAEEAFKYAEKLRQQNSGNVLMDSPGTSGKVGPKTENSGPSTEGQNLPDGKFHSKLIPNHVGPLKDPLDKTPESDLPPSKNNI